ncbi:HNH endonuclease [Leptospira interrogans]
MATQERLKQLADYDPTTGVFTAKKTRGKSKEGQELGTLRQDGYRAIMIDGKWYKAHRLAWLYVYGAFPDGLLDHRNRDRQDNRIANLREASYVENSVNAEVRSEHTGIYPVSRNKGTGFQVYVFKNGKNVSLGTFDDLQKAVELRSRVANDLYGEYAKQVA